MDTNGNIQQRLETLEREVADLKRQVCKPSGDWFDQASGSMTEIPQEAFAEFVRYGEESRQAQTDATD